MNYEYMSPTKAVQVRRGTPIFPYPFSAYSATWLTLADIKFRDQPGCAHDTGPATTMTASLLALLIFLAILAQVVFFAGFAFLRHWEAYRALREQLDPSETHAAAPPPPMALAVGDGWAGFRTFRVVRRERENADGDIGSFYLEPEDGASLPPFLPGQFLTFRLTVADPAGGAPRQLVRCYSLSDAPRRDYYRVTIKRVPAPPEPAGLPPGLSSNHFHDRVQVGDRLEVRAPSGQFHLGDEPAVPLVLVAGGIGITPMLSILNQVLPEGREVRLYYGVRNGAEAAQLDSLRGLAASHPHFTLHLCYSRPAPDEVLGRDYQHAARVDIGLLRRTLPLKRHQFYVCGPKGMMESLVPALAEAGVAPEDLRYESFGPASLAPQSSPAKEAAHHAIRFARSDQTLEWDGTAESLLAFAEAHGIAADSGCRAGACGCCQTRLLEGEVSYRQPPEVAVAPGHCLLCVATPASDLTLEL